MRIGAADLVIGCRTSEEVLSIFEELDLWLELASLLEVTEVLDSYSVEVRAVQAYELHRMSLVSPSREERRAAVRHIQERVELAAKVGAERMVTVPGYGFAHAPRAWERCVESFRKLAEFASEYGVSIAIEALSPKRTSFLPSLSEVVALVREINRENVHAMADTLHLHDAGEDVAEVLATYRDEIVELHLRDSGNLPPGRGSMNFNHILSQVKADLCLEYGRSDEKTLREAVELVRSLSPR